MRPFPYTSLLLACFEIKYFRNKQAATIGRKTPFWNDLIDTYEKSGQAAHERKRFAY